MTSTAKPIIALEGFVNVSHTESFPDWTKSTEDTRKKVLKH
jgi:hypothetical protein